MLVSKVIDRLPLRSKLNRAFGRSGKILTRHRGGGTKKKFLIVDFGRKIWNLSPIVYRIEKSKNKPYFLALLVYPMGVISYIPAPLGLQVGQRLISSNLVPISIGNNTYLKNIPLNTKIHNIEAHPNSGAVYVRGAGMWAKIVEKDKISALVLFKNGKTKSFSLFCTATIGQISNTTHYLDKLLYKAGQTRNLAFRPRVRGVAMNAKDHPHGGGKGKKSPKNPNYNFKKLLPKFRKTSSRSGV